MGFQPFHLIFLFSVLLSHNPTFECSLGCSLFARRYNGKRYCFLFLIIHQSRACSEDRGVAGVRFPPSLQGQFSLCPDACDISGRPYKTRFRRFKSNGFYQFSRFFSNDRKMLKRGFSHVLSICPRMQQLRCGGAESMLKGCSSEPAACEIAITHKSEFWWKQNLKHFAPPTSIPWWAKKLAPRYESGCNQL